jgi:hypothetical protein
MNWPARSSTIDAASSAWNTPPTSTKVPDPSRLASRSYSR